MPRYYYGEGRESVESYKKIEISTLKKAGFLDKGVNCRKGVFSCGKNGNISIEVKKGESNGYIRVSFIQTNYLGEEKKCDYQIPLVTTPCNYGGVRWWFLCPCKGNRCAVLYLQNNGVFASRKTLNLCYENQKMSKKSRLLSYLMGDVFTKMLELDRTIKYPYRNGKPTRKMKRIIKLRERLPSREEVENISELMNWS